MFYHHFVCGAFRHQEGDDDFDHQEGDDDFWIEPVSTPRKSRRRKDSKNPYSTRGLDQFSAVLAELEEKRQQIYSQMGTQGMDRMVRFVYKNSNDCVPLVVKLKDKKDDKIKSGTTNDHQPQMDVSEVTDKLQTPSRSDQKNKKKKSFSWIDKLLNLRRSPYYIPAVIILILLSLVFFGRSAAILCTCIGWYMVSTISEEGSNLRTSMKKTNYVRNLSENKAVSGKVSSPKSYRRDKFPQSI